MPFSARTVKRGLGIKIGVWIEVKLQEYFVLNTQRRIFLQDLELIDSRLRASVLIATLLIYTG